MTLAAGPNGAGRGRRPGQGAAVVIWAAALWATFGPLARILYDMGYSPFELASVRTWLGLVGAGLTALVMRVPLRIDRRDVAFFAAYGVIGFAAFETLLLLSFEHVTIPVAISLLYTAPAFVLLFSKFLFAEPVTRAKQAALPLSVLGVVLVSGAAGSLVTGQATIPLAGLLLGLGAGLGYALYTIFGRYSVPRAHPVAAVFWSFLFAALALTLLASPVAPLVRDAAAIPWLLALGVVPTLLPYLLYLRALRTTAPGTAAMLACIEPVVAAMLAAFVVGERLTAVQALGMAMIVGAAVVLVSPAARRVT